MIDYIVTIIPIDEVYGGQGTKSNNRVLKRFL